MEAATNGGDVVLLLDHGPIMVADADGDRNTAFLLPYSDIRVCITSEAPIASSTDSKVDITSSPMV
jgi:hypothetical protein